MKPNTAKKGIYYKHDDYPLVRYLGLANGDLLLCVVPPEYSYLLDTKVTTSDNYFWGMIYEDSDQSPISTHNDKIKKEVKPRKKWILTYTGNVLYSAAIIYAKFTCNTRRELRDTKKRFQSKFYGCQSTITRE